MKEPEFSQWFRLCFGCGSLSISIKLLLATEYQEMNTSWVGLFSMITMIYGVYLLKRYFKN